MDLIFDPETDGAIELLDIFKALEARGLIEVEVDDLGEVHVWPTKEGLAVWRANQPSSGLRGDPVAPRTVTLPTRGSSS